MPQKIAEELDTLIAPFESMFSSMNADSFINGIPGQKNELSTILDSIKLFRETSINEIVNESLVERLTCYFKPLAVLIDIAQQYDFDYLLDVLKNLRHNLSRELVRSIIISSAISTFSLSKTHMLHLSAKSIIVNVEVIPRDPRVIINNLKFNVKTINTEKRGEKWSICGLVSSERNVALEIKFEINEFSFIAHIPIMENTFFARRDIFFDINIKKIGIFSQLHEIRIELYNNTSRPVEHIAISVSGEKIYPSNLIIIKQLSPGSYLSKSVIVIPRSLPQKVFVRLRGIIGGQEITKTREITLQLQYIGLKELRVYHAKSMITLYSIYRDENQDMLIGGLISAANSILSQVIGENGAIDRISLPSGHLYIKNGKNVIVALLCKIRTPIISNMLSEILFHLDRLPEIKSFDGMVPKGLREKISKILANSVKRYIADHIFPNNGS